MKILEVLKFEMIAEFLEKYGEFEIPETCPSLESCFTTEDAIIMLWLNTPDQSTHLIVRKINN